MRAKIKRGERKRVVVIGGGLGGLRLVKALRKSEFQVVLIDKNNYHQFPPLIYQVSSAGLEPSNISFPFRRSLQDREDFFFRMGEVLSIDGKEKALQTTFGTVHYDYLVIAAGATTNFFGNENIEKNALPMKTVTEAMKLRNTLLENLEKAEVTTDELELQELMTVVVVGGGPSGVEIAGAMAEMKRVVVPHDYPDLDSKKIQIILVNSGDRLLKSMDEASSARAERDLRSMGVDVMLGKRVTDYRDKVIYMNDGSTIPAATVIWVSGIRACEIASTPEMTKGAGGRIVTDTHLRVKGLDDVFAIGDVSIVEGDEKYPNGHPQLAQVAMQMADYVVDTLKHNRQADKAKPFRYINLGTMATIGRKKAVAEIGGLKFGGFVAWMLWLVIHLRSILGVRNRIFVFLNWIWNYVNYRQSLRLILK
jgi:NADH dehydrogenase